MNKLSLFALILPACFVVNGCASSQKQTDPPPPPPTPTDTAASPAAPAPPPKKTYRVVNPADEGMPSQVVSALKKVALPPPPASMPTPEKATLQFVTSKGKIKVLLRGDKAPLQVKSFVYLVKKGFYNGTLFHRYANLLASVPGSETGYIIQGGDPLTKNPKLKQFFGAGGPGYQVPREHNDLTHKAFVIAAARSNDPDSAGSQFYFTDQPVHFLDKGYTVFGKVLSGKDVVKKLRADDKLDKVKVLSVVNKKEAKTKKAKSDKK